MLKTGKAQASITYKVQTGCGPMFVTIVYDEEFFPVDLLIHAGKAGGCASAHLSSHAAKIRELFEERNYSQRKIIYSKLIGTSCFQQPCCIEAVFRTVTDFEDELYYMREEE